MKACIIQPPYSRDKSFSDAYFKYKLDLLDECDETIDIIKCCVGWDGDQDPMSMVERAVRLGAKKIQLFKPHFNQETVKKAHENGIKCNVFWADDSVEARQYLEMGIDTILTNDYHTISQLIKNGL